MAGGGGRKRGENGNRIEGREKQKGAGDRKFLNGTKGKVVLVSQERKTDEAGWNLEYNASQVLSAKPVRKHLFCLPSVCGTRASEWL